VPLCRRDPGAGPLVPPPDAARPAAHAAPREHELVAARGQGRRATETARALKAARRLFADVA
jgi:hypothetical protein